MTVAEGPRPELPGRALAALCCAALLTLLVGAVGDPAPWPPIVLGVAFTAAAVLGFDRVRDRASRWWSSGYVAVQFVLAFAVFSLAPGVGGTLFLVALVCQCVLLLPWPVTALVVVAAPLVHVGMAVPDAIREGTGTVAALVFGAVVTELLRREQQARAELTVLHRRLRDYAAQAEALATEQERNRVARDIHDGLGHSLTVVQMQLKAARAVLGTEPDRADDVLAKAQHQAEQALAEVRRSVRTLREPRRVPDLSDAIGELVAESSAGGIRTDLAVTGTPRPLPDAAREALHRAAMEGLTNVRKHSGADTARVTVDYRPDTVRLEVHDDGTGSQGPAPDGFGLVGLRERTELQGGRMSAGPAPGGGWVVTVEVPA